MDLLIGWLPTLDPPVQPVFSAVGGCLNQQRGSNREDVVLQATELSCSVNHANGLWSLGILEARETIEIGDFLCLEEHVIFRIARRTLYANKDFSQGGADDTDAQPSGTDQCEVPWSHNRTLAPRLMFQAYHS